jgi:hypothetical protein
MGDYIAIIRIGAGSSHGRAYTKEGAVKNALIFLKDWEDLYDIPEQDMEIPVYDVEGFSKVQWGTNGIHGTREATGLYEEITKEPEMITAHYKPKKRKRA